MKKLIFFTFLLCIQIAIGQENTIPKDQLKAIQETYNWGEEQFLIINYRQPKNFCSYNNYENLAESENWFKNNVFNKLDLSECRTIFIYDDKINAGNFLDFTTHYDDVGHYFLQKFFNQKGFCYGLLVISKNGTYLKEMGEYNHKNIASMIDQLSL